MHGGTSLGLGVTQGPTQDRLLQGLIRGPLLLEPTLAQLPLELTLAQLPLEPSQDNLAGLGPILALLGPILLLHPMAPPLEPW